MTRPLNDQDILLSILGLDAYMRGPVGTAAIEGGSASLAQCICFNLSLPSLRSNISSSKRENSWSFMLNPRINSA